MNEDLQNEVNDLRDEVDALKEERKKMMDDYSARMDAVEKVLKEHAHQKGDGSSPIEKDIELLSGQSFTSGEVGTFYGIESAETDRTLAIVVTGRDKSAAEGIQNSQVQLEHQYGTDSTTRQSFYYGIRGPIYQGSSGTIESGDVELTQNDWQWVTDELAGARILVYTADQSTFAGYTILSNTEKTLTITGGTWGFTGTGLFYQVFMPVYLGGSTYPWRRIYVEEGTAGGIRIGLGATAGGQNGLIYMDDAGDLYWRNKAGSSGKLNSSSSAFLNAGDGSTLTISSGSITLTNGFHNVDTQGAAASDDLDTLNSSATEGSVVVLKAADSARTVVLKDGTGNLRLAGDFSMDNNRDTITLIYKDSVWMELARGDNGS